MRYMSLWKNKGIHAPLPQTSTICVCRLFYRAKSTQLLDSLPMRLQRFYNLTKTRNFQTSTSYQNAINIWHTQDFPCICFIHAPTI